VQQPWRVAPSGSDTRAVLRIKLGPARSHVETVVGLGYRFNDSKADE